MFSQKEKQFIAAEIEKLLISLEHPEMPKDKPMFSLHVTGKESWSWADIRPNWTFDETNAPGVNSWNEVARHTMLYDPSFGDDTLCQCGHTYYRHFDSYEDAQNRMHAACKYCRCQVFVSDICSK